MTTFFSGNHHDVARLYFQRLRHEGDELRIGGAFDGSGGHGNVQRVGNPADTRNFSSRLGVDDEKEGRLGKSFEERRNLIYKHRKYKFLNNLLKTYL